tara:strand:- start:6624 stop:7037 length:414 start_codon:yes stop_codon:yes gene_type:complete
LPHKFLLRDGRAVIFDTTCLADEVVIESDVAKIEASYRRSGPHYVGFNGIRPFITASPDFGIKAQMMNQSCYKRFMEFLERKEEAVLIPEMGVDEIYGAYVRDGRHRFAVLRDLGLRTIPIRVKKTNAALWQKLFAV